MASNLLHPAVSTLLQHYRARFRTSLAPDSPLHARLLAAGLLPNPSDDRPPLGLVDRTAHRLLDQLSAREQRAWRSAWMEHGLLGLDGREAFKGCLVAPLLVWGEVRPALVGLPLRALVNPRGVALLGRTDRFAIFVCRALVRTSSLICCSDPFDAAWLRSNGDDAIAALGVSSTPEEIARLASMLRTLQPRRLRIACASSSRGRDVREAWQAAARAAWVRAEVVELPAGCGIRDLYSLSGGAGLANLLSVQRPALRAATAASPRGQPTAILTLPWSACQSPLARDLTAYLDHRAARGDARGDCRRRALALAHLWRTCANEGVVATDQLAAACVERFQAGLLRATAAGSPERSRGATIRILSSARGFLTWALRSGLLTRDVAASIAPLRRPMIPPPLVLSEDEIERALSLIPLKGRAGLRDRAMLEVLYSSGVRRAELVGLDVADLDPVRRVLRVQRGKGGRTRLVPLGLRAVAWVQRYVEAVRPRQLRDAAEPALFLSRCGQRLCAKTVTARMHATLRAAGIRKPGSCHIIRHSVATLMHDAGADIRDLQVLLGHALLTSTQLYTRVSMVRLLEVHARTHPAERTKGAPIGGGLRG